MAGLQICVRMTDGISFSLSSHCHSNKGLIEGEGAPTREKKTLGQRTLGEGWKEAGREKGRASVLKRWYHSGCEPRPKKQVPDRWEHRSLTWLYSTRWSRPMAWYRLCCLLPNQQALAASQRCGWVRGWQSPVASVEGWRRIRLRGSLLPTVTTSCLAVASCCHPTASDLRYLSNKIY